MSYSSDPAGLQNQLPLSIDISEDPKDMRNEVNDLYQSIASSVNNKIGGLYVPQEKINSEQYFDRDNVQKFRNVYRMTVDFGALPNSATNTVSHTIKGWNSKYRLTSSWGASTDPVALEAVPIPNEGIFLKINATSVIITTTSNFSSFTDTTIVLEYTKG